MRILAIVLALGIVSCQPPQPGSSANPIINGEACGAAVQPSAVAVLTDAVITIEGWGTQAIQALTCTGTVIAPDTVLTAAHCLDPTLLTMGFGEVDSVAYSISFQADLQELSGSEPDPSAWPDDAVLAGDWIANPAFDIDDMQNVSGPGNFHDVGLIFLSETVDVPPAVVITADESSQVQEDVEVDIAGWGQQTVTDPWELPPPGTLGIKVCGASTINELGEFEMQVGFNEASTRKCHGDSGGPTYMDVQTSFDEKQRVIGITSHAYDQEDCAKGGVDTRVDAWLDWIDQEMRAACDSGARVWCEEQGIVPPEFWEPAAGDDDDDGGAPPRSCRCGHAAPASVSLLPLLLLAGLLARRTAA